MRGQGRVFPRNGIPWIAYCHSGRELRESAAPAIKETELKKGRPLARDEALIVAQKLLQRRLLMGPRRKVKGEEATIKIKTILKLIEFAPLWVSRRGAFCLDSFWDGQFRPCA